MADAPEQDEPPDADDEACFVEGLLVRGEVAPAATEPLPPGVTHETVDDDEPAVRRRRFSAGPAHDT